MNPSPSSAGARARAAGGGGGGTRGGEGRGAACVVSLIQCPGHPLRAPATRGTRRRVWVGRVERRRAGLPNTLSARTCEAASFLSALLYLFHRRAPQNTAMPPARTAHLSPHAAHPRGVAVGAASFTPVPRKKRKERERKKGGGAQQKIDPAPSSLFFCLPGGRPFPSPPGQSHAAHHPSASPARLATSSPAPLHPLGRPPGPTL